jgi:hypothetical protein
MSARIALLMSVALVPNWPTFLNFADRYIKVVSVSPESK